MIITQRRRGGTGRTIHGMVNSPEYRCWRHMLHRCNNPSDKGWNDYGGRGITVCYRWLEFTNFVQDMGLRPSEAHSIDRIDNDGGYEPSNCRWATHREQVLNRRQRRDNKSGYEGVIQRKESMRYRAYINHHGVRINIGTFVDIIEAVQARQLVKEQLGD